MEILNYLTNDWQALIKVILSDIVLSVDNALVIAMVCAGLKIEHQNTAMKWGMSFAVLARILFLFVAFLLIQIPFLKIVAGAWLIKLGYDMINGNGEDDNPEKKTTLKSAIIAIVVADVAMSLDNVLAVVGATGDGSHIIHSFTMLGRTFDITDAYPLAVVGILISIPILLFASKALMKIIDKYPILNTIGALGITFIGVEMFIKDNVFSNWILEVSSKFDFSLHSVITILSLLITSALFLVFKSSKKLLGNG
jgi:YjbE family integral membrane protein